MSDAAATAEKSYYDSIAGGIAGSPALVLAALVVLVCIIIYMNLAQNNMFGLGKAKPAGARKADRPAETDEKEMTRLVDELEEKQKEPEPAAPAK